MKPENRQSGKKEGGQAGRSITRYLYLLLTVFLFIAAGYLLPEEPGGQDTTGQNSASMQEVQSSGEIQSSKEVRDVQQSQSSKEVQDVQQSRSNQEVQSNQEPLNTQEARNVPDSLQDENDASGDEADNAYAALPDHVKKSFEAYEADQWEDGHPGQTPGTKAGGRFRNLEGRLPDYNEAGEALTYREYDVNNKKEGESRDAERFVVASDGTIYYTDDHYETFIKIAE